MIEAHFALFGFAEPIGAAQQAGLPTAVGPDQPDKFPRTDLQAGVTQLEPVMAAVVTRWGPAKLGEGE